MRKQANAFGWPPGFVNTGTSGFFFLDDNGNLLAESPIVESVVRNSAGNYTITTKYGVGIGWTQNGQGAPRITSLVPIDLVEGKIWRLEIWDLAGTPVDAYVGVWLSIYPLAWAVTP